MTDPSERVNGSTLNASNEEENLLGGQPNEVALFALGHRPTAYRPLTDAEVGYLRAAVAGKLPPSLSGSVREMLKHNSAATEFVLSEQLLSTANRSVDIPSRLSNRILRSAKAVNSSTPSRNWSILSWPYARLGAAAAALAIVVTLYGLHRTDKPDFTIAALDDYEILADSGVVTRGGPQADTQARKKPALKYVEMDIARALLADFFAEDQNGKREEETKVISRLSDALNEKRKVQFIFDAAIKPMLIGKNDETLAVRVYNLSDPANSRLASTLHMSDDNRGYFVSPAPSAPAESSSPSAILPP
jgi:hypothetical protein